MPSSGHTRRQARPPSSIIARFYDVDRGQILVDGRDVRKVTRASRRAYAIVLQDTWVFGGTVFENIACSRAPRWTRWWPRPRAARIPPATSCALPGVTTPSSRRATSARTEAAADVARAMLYTACSSWTRPPATSIPYRTEKVQGPLQDLMKKDLLRHCAPPVHHQHADRILVMEHGDVMEQGTPRRADGAARVYPPAYAARFE